MTIDRILCPVDFSETSAHAVEQAAAMAGWTRARVTALYVTDHEPLQPAERDELSARLLAFSQPVVCTGVGVDPVIGYGRPAVAILAQAGSLPADLIVMGTHGTSGFQHLLLGSVTEHVLRRATCPVLTVPPRVHATSRLPCRHLLCAVDFSDSSLSALIYAERLAREFDAELTLLHAIEWPWEEPPAPDLHAIPAEQAAALAEFRRYSEARARARLEGLASNDTGGRAVAVVRNGKAWEQILAAADESKSDLIVMGVAGRSPLDLVVLGSTANHVVRRARCPVLTLRR
jgi:nucleotide-binding universal stress UspA family protein